MEDVSWRDPERQPAGVHDLEAIRVQVDEDVAALRIWTVNECVDQQLPDNRLLEGRDRRA